MVLTPLSHHIEKIDYRDPSWMCAAVRLIVTEACEPTFAELISIPNFAGDLAFGVPARNICAWPSISETAAKALAHLIDTGEIDMLPCRPEVYAHADVQIPDLPLALGYGPFETPHWLPVKFRAIAIKTFVEHVRYDA
jgi:hypothetical protein